MASLFVPAMTLANDQSWLAIEAIDLAIGDRSVCMVTITNRSAVTSLEAVRVILFDGRGAHPIVGPIDLARGQAMTVDWTPPAETRCSGSETFFRVKFEKSGVANDTVLPSQQTRAAAQAGAGVMIALVTAANSTASVIIGAILVHFFSAARERDKERTTFHAKKRETVDAAVREFLADWKESPVTARLQQHFDELRRKAALPSSLVELYQNTCVVLSDNTLSVEVRMTAVRELSRRLTVYIDSYDPGARG